jgi:predicted dehydrogenase
MYRHHAQTWRVRDLVEQGRIGQPMTARGSFSFPLTYPGDVRLDPVMGGGSLWDVGCYPLSFARTAFGEQPIEASGWSRLGQTGIDTAFWGAVRFPSGAVAQLDCSFTAPYRSHMELVGTEGIIVVPHPFKPDDDETFYAGPDSQHLEPIRVTGGPLYAGEVEDLTDAVLLGTTPRVTLADSRANTAAIVALLASAAAGGAPVPITG